MVILKATYMVKPAENTPNCPMSLSDFDQNGEVTHEYEPTIYFYQNPIDFESATDILKHSLSKALVPFYPLAGRLRWISGGCLELDCNSMGAKLLVAESESKISDFGDFRPTPQIRTLIPSVDYNTPIHELPLLVAQVTNLSCGGISLGLVISHVVVDGPSALHFIAEWARIARHNQCIINTPFLDRTILKLSQPLLPPSSYDHPELTLPPQLICRSTTLNERKKETSVVILKLTKEEMEKLKNKANKGGASYNNGHAYSKYEAVAGHMLRCASKARMHMSDQLTRLYIVVDAWNRLKPPLPRHYFGNAVLRVAVTTTSGELLSQPLSYASSKIRETTTKVTDEYIRSHLKFVKDVSKYRNFNYFHGNPNMAITSWVNLPLYGVDFGWGKEVHMGPGAIGFDGKSFILPGRDEDGSFIIALRLQVAHMKDFKKFFYEEI